MSCSEPHYGGTRPLFFYWLDVFFSRRSQSQPSEEVPLPIPAPLRAHMEDECFWILCQNKVHTHPPTEGAVPDHYLLFSLAAAQVAKEAKCGGPSPPFLLPEHCYTHRGDKVRPTTPLFHPLQTHLSSLSLSHTHTHTHKPCSPDRGSGWNKDLL